MPSSPAKSQFLSLFRKEIQKHARESVVSRGATPLSTTFRELESHTTLHVSSDNQYIEKVSICHCNLQEVHLRALLDCLRAPEGVRVTELVLNHCDISEHGGSLLAESLAKNDQLTSIELFGNQLSDSSMTQWSEYIYSSRNLVRLKMGDNIISPHGVFLLADALSYNTSLVQLHLGGNQIEDDGLIALCSTLISRNHTLSSVALRENGITEKGIHALSELLARDTCQLTDIQLKGNPLGPEGACELAQALSKNHSLKVLELHSTDIGARGARVCCEAMQQNETIHAVNFNVNGIMDEGAKSVADLISFGRVATLGLSDNDISWRGARSLARAFQFSNLTGLDLGSNSKIGNRGAVEIAKALRDNTTALTSIDLRSCGIGPKGCAELADMLCCEHVLLQHLDLGNNKCKNDGAIALGKMLEVNCSLRRLCLTDNCITNRGAIALCSGLAHNVTLVSLSSGGQGEKQNKISSPLRNILDSIIKENKRITKTNSPPVFSHGESSGKESFSRYFSTLQTWKEEAVSSSSNQNRLVDVEDVLNSYKRARKAGGAPHWVQSVVPPRFSESELQTKLMYLFHADKIPHKNTQYPDYVYLSDLKDTLSEYFPETKDDLSSLQLLQFLFRRQNFFVYLPPNASLHNIQGAQVKLLLDSRPTRRKKSTPPKEFYRGGSSGGRSSSQERTPRRARSRAKIVTSSSDSSSTEEEELSQSSSTNISTEDPHTLASQQSSPSPLLLTPTTGTSGAKANQHHSRMSIGRGMNTSARRGLSFGEQGVNSPSNRVTSLFSSPEEQNVYSLFEGSNVLESAITPVLGRSHRKKGSGRRG